MGTQLLKCANCKEQKPTTEYYKLSNRKRGYQYCCKICHDKRCKSSFNRENNLKWQKEYRQKNKEKYKSLYKKYAKKWAEKNKEYRIKNRERIAAYDKKRWAEKREQILAVTRKYVNERKKNDPLYKLKRHMVSVCSSAVKRYTGKRKAHKTINILGASHDIVKQHLERQFKEGMTWENHGNGSGKWHIDHIIPLSSAKTEEDVIVLCHYTNLQPLWSKDNLIKRNKIPQVQTKLPI